MALLPEFKPGKTIAPQVSDIRPLSKASKVSKPAGGSSTTLDRLDALDTPRVSTKAVKSLKGSTVPIADIRDSDMSVSPPSPIDPAIVSTIAAIEPLAIACGWSHQRLWQHEFWPRDGERGLASVLDPEDTIVEVTTDAITIAKPSLVLTHFQRHQS
jgi:hypothetical protein